MTAARMLENMWGVTSGLTAKIAVAAIALTACVSSAWAQSDEATNPLNVQMHEDTGPKVEVFWLDGERISVVASCSGCTLFVDALEWTQADNATARQYIDAPIDIFEGAVDETTIYPILERDVPFGLDVIVYSLNENTWEVVETKSTFFGIPRDGYLESITWVEFACLRGLAECQFPENDPDGVNGIVLNLQLPLAEDAEDDAHVGGAQ